MAETEYFPRIEDVVMASKILDEVIEPTPMLLNQDLTDKYGADIYLKREDLQIVRSYKIRGAYNKIRTIPPDELKYGIVCASAGNHAQGVAFSCNKLHIMGSIYMPTTTPKQKIEQVRMFGKNYIDIVLTGDTFDAANKEAVEYAAKSGKTFIPPFDDKKIIEGQATIGLEIEKQMKKPLDYLFIPIGGGGLASGVGAYMKLASPETKIIGVEPAGAPVFRFGRSDGGVGFSGFKHLLVGFHAHNDQISISVFGYKDRLALGVAEVRNLVSVAQIRNGTYKRHGRRLLCTLL